MSEVSLKVQDVEGYRNLFDFNDGTCVIPAYLRISHNHAVVFPMTSTKTNRVIINVPEKGEETTIEVLDIKTGLIGVRDIGADTYTYSDALFMNYHVGSECVALDSDYLIVATGEIKLVGAANKAVFDGDLDTTTIVGFRQEVTGDRVLLSCGIGLTNMVVRQTSGTREYEVIHLEEGDS